MKTAFTPQAARDYKKLSAALQERVDKQMALLRQNLRQPSLKAKKYNEEKDIWQAE
jgi:mRNA-degrading endonuclease RelE of RelBE toxin-antitoxin system